MELSARNVLPGTVLDIKEGPVSTQIHIDIGGGTTVTSTITTDAAGELGLSVGSKVSAIVKASDVLLATD